MDDMDIFQKIRDILVEIMDVDVSEVTPETYLIRELDAESIDLLEMGVSLNSAFSIPVVDDDIFLRQLRLIIDEASEKGVDREAEIQKAFPFLSVERAGEIISDLDSGPVLKVKDLVSYVEWRKKGA